MKTKPMRNAATGIALIVFAVALLKPNFAIAQNDAQHSASPTGALFRSLLVPGWGQYYTEPNDWTRGKIHFITDVALLGSYFGVHINTNQLQASRTAFAAQHAGIDLSEVNRTVRLYVAEFNSVQEYNDFQERSRNWNLLLTDSYWNWNSETNRKEFQQLNNRIDQQRQQLPAIVSLMIINRVIAGIHAYSNAIRYNQDKSPYSFSIEPSALQTGGYAATLRVSF